MYVLLSILVLPVVLDTLYIHFSRVRLARRRSSTPVEPLSRTSV